MKQLLLVATIHLLILHQYKKDKSEELAPNRDAGAKPARAWHGYPYQVNGPELYPADSLQFAYQVSQGSFYFTSYDEPW